MSGESKGGEEKQTRESTDLDEFIHKLTPQDRVAVFTLGRFHPVTKGHMELIEEVMDTAETIKTSIPVCERKPPFSVDSFIWLSPTNVEEDWYHNPEISELKKRAQVASSDPRERRLIGREQKKKE